MTSFEDIDARRAAHGISRRAVYKRASVDGETWRRIAKGMHAPNVRTLAKLKAALDQLIQERAA